MRVHGVSLTSRSFVRPMLCGRCRLNSDPSNWPTMPSAERKSRKSHCFRTGPSSARKMENVNGRKSPGWCTVIKTSSSLRASKSKSPGWAVRRNDAGSNGWSGS